MKIAVVWAVLTVPCFAQVSFSPEVQKYISIQSPTIALTHVKVIDGTGAPALEDRTIILNNGKIQSVGSSVTNQLPGGAKILDLHGYTVIPGLIGMHNHLYDTAFINRDAHGNILPPGFLVTEIPYTAPRLYLAAGVTTMRPAGNVEGYT